ncbi:MAG: hypothetical protein KC457_27460, partial [Myxococcales bacterium]|nr:hypothetical protein [Myxococcales bacterium]
GYLRPVDGRSALIIRGEIGLERRYRGRRAFARFTISQSLRLWFRNLHRRKFGFACPVHPSSYWGVTRRVETSWPRPGVETPPAVEQAMLALADDFGLERVGEDPLVRRVGWCTRDRHGDQQYWAGHGAAEVRYFRARNPGYHRGEGLLTLWPLSLAILLRTAVGLVGERMGAR